MAVVSESEFKGNKMIVLKRTEDDRFPFQFGLSKAKLILDSLEELKAWVAKQEGSKPKAAAGAEE